MDILFIFGSILIITLLMKCIYNNLGKGTSEKEDEYQPNLEDTLISLLTYFKTHIHQFTVYSDKIVIYCFKNSPQDDISNFNEIKIRFSDIGFKSIAEDECQPLQERLKVVLETS